MAARLAKLLFLALVAIALAVAAIVLAASAAAARSAPGHVDAASGTVTNPAATAWLIIGLVALTALLAAAATRRRRHHHHHLR
jgi:MYXO-CTERM domain-containing protein